MTHSSSGSSPTGAAGRVHRLGPMSVDAVPQADTIHIHLDPAETLAAYARHRRRFASEVASLAEDALATRSRCTKWSVADVLRHCADVDDWMTALWSGGPPPFTSFDPNTTPHEFVLVGRSMSDVDARDRYVASAEKLAADVGSSGPQRWGQRSVSPVGFVPWWLSALHVFFDSWLHERDVLLPLGIEPPVVPDEAIPVLAYTLAIAGTIVAEPTDAVIAGVRVVAGQPGDAQDDTPGFSPVADTAGVSRLQPVTVTVVRPPPEDVDVGIVIDALGGRAPVDDAFPGIDRDVVERLSKLGRLLREGDEG